MVKRVLLIGGYGNFGRYIAKKLAPNPGLRLIIAGRDKDKANTMADTLTGANEPVAAAFDITGKLDRALEVLDPDIVIHTSGPFQKQAPFVAAACIRQGCHYIDLADARSFVAGIGQLDEAARLSDLSIISGASSIPALSSAVIDAYRRHFDVLESVEYGISTAQKTNRGLATTQAVLSYAGKPFLAPVDGKMRVVFGWQDLIRHPFKKLGRRWLANCDVPDLTLFPSRYPGLKTVRFRAGLELSVLQLALFGLTWVVRLGIIRNLKRYARPMLKASFLLDSFGSDQSGFYMTLSGTGTNGEPKEITFDLTAKSGDGAYIPCMPAILLTERLVAGAYVPRGAQPCMGMISLDDYLAALEGLDIAWETDGA